MLSAEQIIRVVNQKRVRAREEILGVDVSLLRNGFCGYDKGSCPHVRPKTSNIVRKSSRRQTKRWNKSDLQQCDVICVRQLLMGGTGSNVSGSKHVDKQRAALANMPVSAYMSHLHPLKTCHAQPRCRAAREAQEKQVQRIALNAECACGEVKFAA